MARVATDGSMRLGRIIELHGQGSKIVDVARWWVGAVLGLMLLAVVTVFLYDHE